VNLRFFYLDNQVDCDNIKHALGRANEGFFEEKDQMLKRAIVLIVTVVSLNLSGVDFVSAVQPSFQSIGEAEVYDMASDGSVLVGSAGFGNDYVQGFRWQNGVMVPLGGLTNTPNPPYFLSYADGISADGKTIVGVSNSPSGNQAYKWEDGVMTGLGYLPGSSSGSRALAASNDGSVIVGNAKIAAYPQYESVRWVNGAISTVNSRYPSTAYDVTPDGTVIVGDCRDGAYRWENGSYSIISQGTAWKATPDGEVVIGWGSSAFRWEDGVTANLGFLPGDSSSYAYGVNHDGSVIVGTSDYSAFIWDPANGMRDLKTVLENDYGIDLTGWTLEQARCLSDDGRTIAGWGVGPGSIYTQSWIATIPEPATLLLFAFAGLALRRKR
jgi:probable HAF family extracellular repeat protein